MCVLSRSLALVVVFGPFQCAKVFSLCRSYHCAVILKGFVAILVMFGERLSALLV